MLVYNIYNVTITNDTSITFSVNAVGSWSRKFHEHRLRLKWLLVISNKTLNFKSPFYSDKFACCFQRNHPVFLINTRRFSSETSTKHFKTQKPYILRKVVCFVEGLDCRLDISPPSFRQLQKK